MCKRLGYVDIFGSEEKPLKILYMTYLPGVNRFYRDVEVMLGFPVDIWIKVCWAVLAPMFSLVQFKK